MMRYQWGVRAEESVLCFLSSESGVIAARLDTARNGTRNDIEE